MYYAYVLKSLNSDYYYKGHCSNLAERLKQHNSGMTISIKAYIAFEVVTMRSSKLLGKPSSEKNISKQLREEGLLKRF